MANSAVWRHLYWTRRQGVSWNLGSLPNEQRVTEIRKKERVAETWVKGEPLSDVFYVRREKVTWLFWALKNILFSAHGASPQIWTFCRISKCAYQFLLLESSVHNCVGENSNIQKGRSAVSPDFIKIIEKRPFSHVTNVWLVFKYYLRILNHA